MRRLIPGERIDLTALSGSLLSELRVRLRGRDVVQQLPPGCRLWAVGLSEHQPPVLLASGPAVASFPPHDHAGGEDRVPGVVLRPTALEQSSVTRIKLGMTWQRPPAVPVHPLLLELRTGSRVVAGAELEPPHQPHQSSGPGAVLLAELYQRGGVWRIRNHSEWLAGGQAELEERWALPKGALERAVAPPAPEPSLPRPPVPEPSVRPEPAPAPAVAPVPVTPAPPPAPSQTTSLPEPATIPPTTHVPEPEVTAPVPSLSERLTGLWNRLRRAGEEHAEGSAHEEPSSAAPTVPSTALPPRTAQALNAVEERLQVLREVLEEERQRGSAIGSDAIRQQARLETFADTLATLRQEALDLQRRKDQAQRLGLALPAAALELEGEIERSYRALVQAVEAQAQQILHGTALGSRERLGRERLFLESLSGEQGTSPTDGDPLKL